MPNPHNPDSTEKHMSSMQKLRPLVFDIETGVRPEVLEHPADWFKADSRLKDPEKIKADLAEKAAGGALSLMTGKVLAIGFGAAEQPVEVFVDGHGCDEHRIISEFLDRASERILQGVQVIGFNCLDFDIPFLLFRARVLGIRVPVCLGSIYRSKWCPSELFVDLMLRAQFGRYDRAGYSLDRVCRAFELPGKTGNGADFQRLLAERPEEAIEYLKNDIRCTAALSQKLL